MEILSRFPKIRHPLPPDYQAIYLQHYINSRSGLTTTTSLAGKLERWLHRKVAADIKSSSNQKNTLEIGAGTLNHIDYEINNGSYSIIEPFSELYSGSLKLNRIADIFADISEIPMIPTYDRIISIATFEHILNLPEVVAKSALLLNEKGSLRVAIPSEGGLLWKLAWKMTTALEFKMKYGLNYEVLMQYEHVNTASEIDSVISFFFKKIHRKYFGIGNNFSFYQFYECSQPETKTARQFLENNLIA